MSANVPDVELISILVSSKAPKQNISSRVSPLKVDRLDDKSQRWAHSADIFIHDPFDDSRFARIVKAASRSLARVSNVEAQNRQHQHAHLLVLQPSLPQYREHFQDMNLC